MPRKPQFGSIYRRGAVLWIKYYREGKPFYESAQSDKQGDAQRLLNKRRAEIYNGTHLESKARKVLVTDFLDDLIRDYRTNGKDHVWCEGVVRNRLRPAFGAMQAAKIGYGDGQRYIERRQNEGAPNSTINREIALLRRSFNLAKRSGKLPLAPLLPGKLAEHNVRKGFFEREDFLKLREALPNEIRPVVSLPTGRGAVAARFFHCDGLRWIYSPV
jgi:hypothetical protein